MEIDALRPGAALDLDAAQHVAPHRLRPGPHGVEIERGDLGEAVFAGVLRTHRRKPHSHRQRVEVRSEREHRLPVAEQHRIDERSGKTRREVDVVVVHPALGAAHARKFGGSRLPQLAQVDRLVGDRVHEVDDHPPRPFAAERIAVHARAGRRRQFDADAFVGQRHGVITARGLFVVVRERIGHMHVFAFAHRIGTRGGVEQDIGQIGAARTAQVGVRKAVDRRVVVMVARTGIPVARPRVGAELNHSEGCRGPRIGVAVESGSDERIHTADRIGRLRACDGQGDCARRWKGSSHVRSKFQVHKYSKPLPDRKSRFAHLHPHITQTLSCRPENRRSGPFFTKKWYL